MSTHNTITVIITDTSLSEENAGQLATEIQAAITRKCKMDSRVTSVTPILTTDTATITIA